MTSRWLILYLLAAAALLLGLLLELQWLYVTAKPLLMVTLGFYFTAASRGYPPWRYYVLAALVFSWAGDVLLIWPDGFMAGLIAFLIAHVCYIIAYHQTGAASGNLKPLDIIKFVLFGIVLIWVIYPGLGDLLIPVLIYALILLMMGVWAHKRRGATNSASFTLVATGAMLFVLSDGLIAVNKFAYPVPSERVVVMIIYMSAQYLIVRGLVNHRQF